MLLRAEVVLPVGHNSSSELIMRGKHSLLVKSKPTFFYTLIDKLTTVSYPGFLIRKHNNAISHRSGIGRFPAVVR